MNQKQINLGSIFLYLLSGLAAVALASWLSTQLIGKAFSQTNFPPAQVAPQKNVSVDPAGNASGNSAGNQPNTVQSTGSQIITVTPAVKKDHPLVIEPSQESKIPELLVGIIEDYDYVATGKRDPFTPFERASSTAPMGPIWPLQKYDLEQLKLVGVIWEVKTPKAMILDPTGHGYVVTINERIGRNNGYIARIREGEIVVVENIVGVDGKASYVTKLMKLHPQ